MLLHEGLLGTVLLLGQGLVLVPGQPRQKYLLEQAELLGVRVGRRRGLGVVVGVVVVHHLGEDDADDTEGEGARLGGEVGDRMDLRVSLRRTLAGV